MTPVGWANNELQNEMAFAACCQRPPAPPILRGRTTPAKRSSSASLRFAFLCEQSTVNSEHLQHDRIATRSAQHREQQDGPALRQACGHLDTVQAVRACAGHLALGGSGECVPTVTPCSQGPWCRAPRELPPQKLTFFLLELAMPGPTQVQIALPCTLKCSAQHELCTRGRTPTRSCTVMNPGTSLRQRDLN